MEDWWSSFLTLVPLIAVAAVLGYVADRQARHRIEEHLFGKGASDVMISRVWFSRSGHHTVYDVEYVDVEGFHRHTRCKVRPTLFGGDKIYWTESP